MTVRRGVCLSVVLSLLGCHAVKRSEGVDVATILSSSDRYNNKPVVIRGRAIFNGYILIATQSELEEKPPAYIEISMKEVDRLLSGDAILDLEGKCVIATGVFSSGNNHFAGRMGELRDVTSLEVLPACPSSRY